MFTLQDFAAAVLETVKNQVAGFEYSQDWGPLITRSYMRGESIEDCAQVLIAKLTPAPPAERKES